MARSNQLFTFNMNIIYPKETSESIKYLPEFKCILANIQTVWMIIDLKWYWRHLRVSETSWYSVNAAINGSSSRIASLWLFTNFILNYKEDVTRDNYLLAHYCTKKTNYLMNCHKMDQKKQKQRWTNITTHFSAVSLLQPYSIFFTIFPKSVLRVSILYINDFVLKKDT